MLSHHRLVEKIGEGGMGVVWRAMDTNLDREVAIKVLPDAFSRHPERLARFEREAKLLASLNHPHIAAVYGLHEVDGIRFLAMELVAGEDLARRLGRGSLPLDEAFAVARQAAEALEAAHEKGVIHRDLKPANIQMTPDGKIKVLDFGLAKAFEVESTAHSPSISPTITSVGTAAGVILGTAAYMSPEQARGRPVDKRADIWAFGCLLYEMLAGREVFGGETVSDCIARILEREPDWQTLPTNLPPKVRGLIDRCLQKDPLRRLRDIGEARIILEEPFAEPEAGAMAIKAPDRSVPFTASLAGRATLVMAAALLGALATWLGTGGKPTAPAGGRWITEVARLIQEVGFSEGPTWSPDGSLLAFASNRSGNSEIYVRQIEGGDEVNITKDGAEDFQPAFSPDGKWIAFISTRSSRTGLVRISTPNIEFRTYGGDLWLVPTLGGQARRLAPDANAPAWHPSGKTVIYVSGPEVHRSIMEVDVAGGSPTALLSSADSTEEIVRLQYSPDGRWISFETMSSQLFLMPASGGEPRPLLPAGSHVWDSHGDRFYYVTRDPQGGSRIQTVQVDSEIGETVGEPQTLGVMTGALREMAVSRDGNRMVVSELIGSRNLTRLPLREDGSAPAGPEEVLRPGPGLDGTPSASPDGRRVAYQSDRLRPWDAWVLDLHTREDTRITLPGDDQGLAFPHWLPDGQSFVITRLDSVEANSIWRVAYDGSETEQLLSGGQSLFAWSVSPDSRSMLYTDETGGYSQVFTLDLESRQTRQLTSTPAEKHEAAWSPDGRWIAFIANEGGVTQVWRMLAAGGEAEQLASDEERMRHLFYSPDGAWIYVQLSHRNIYRLPASGGALQKVTEFPASGLFLEEPAISPDGRTLYYSRSNSSSSLWLLTLGEKG